MTSPNPCIHCGARKIIRKGKHSKDGVQKFFCTSCKKYSRKTYKNAAYLKEVKDAIWDQVSLNRTVRNIAYDLKVSPTTVQRYKNEFKKPYRKLIESSYNYLYTASVALLSRQPHVDLEPEDLLHETLLSFSKKSEELPIRDKQHFLAIAVRRMRSLLVDYLRQQSTEKRGGGKLLKISIDENLILGDQNDPNTMIILDGLLSELEIENEDAVRIFELRYFVGCTVSETAEISGLSQATVKRKYNLVKAWLFSKLKDPLPIVLDQTKHDT